MSQAVHEAKAQRILLVLVATEAAILAIMFSGDVRRMVEYIGFVGGAQVPLLGWILAAAVTVAYVWSASSIEDVKRYLLRPSFLKVVAVVAAAMAGIIEEVVFRKLVMDGLRSQNFGTVVQIAASSLSFGVVHLAWGIKNFAAGVNAAVSTAVLGAGLAVVYIAADRNLAPCVVAHGFISALIEPGLMIAAVADRLGPRGAKHSAA